MFFRFAFPLLSMADVALETAVRLVIAVALSFLVGEVIIRVISRAAKRAKLPNPTIRSVREVITAVWVIVSFAWILNILGLTDLLTSLTVSGIIGLAISLGLQTTLANVIAGVFLLQDNALHSGDMILIAGIKGEVVKLGLRNTWLRTEAGDIVIISNSTLSAGPLTNFTAKERLNRRLAQS
jgi:small-conductance mechanosensitive channel